jgi:hypothetical protein
MDEKIEKMKNKLKPIKYRGKMYTMWKVWIGAKLVP